MGLNIVMLELCCSLTFSEKWCLRNNLFALVYILIKTLPIWACQRVVYWGHG